MSLTDDDPASDETIEPSILVRSQVAGDEPWVGSLAAFFQANEASIFIDERERIVAVLASGGAYRGGGGADAAWTLEQVSEFMLSPPQLTIVRQALAIAYADDDAAIYDRPEGSAEVAGLYKLFGGDGVAFPTSGPSIVR